MVKVISIEIETWRTSCNKCRTVLEYSNSDLKQRKTMDYGEVYNIDYGFDCPVCNTFQAIK